MKQGLGWGYSIEFMKPYMKKKRGLQGQSRTGVKQNIFGKSNAFNGFGSNAKNKNQEKNHSVNSLQTKVVSLVSI